jgi:hypothetical protein
VGKTKPEFPATIYVTEGADLNAKDTCLLAYELMSECEDGRIARYQLLDVVDKRTATEIQQNKNGPWIRVDD